MAFWSIELEPDKPFTHRFDKALGRLHISQATLGKGIIFSDYDDIRRYDKECVVQCIVGDKGPFTLCTMRLDSQKHRVSLDIEFEEEDVDVVFIVNGNRYVHLTGYYLGNNHHTEGNVPRYNFS
ncbi:hypothetical protein MKW94_017817 [Papaver nudicaule]|uniref:Nucleoplasmin-like domain-containing protein n=1 Tax=Papaver nudicaule TaxID=74823 RepID=A0AA41SFG9_PAPNU|nr:hypothetical protein [Papaver nudicaule]